MKVEKKKVEFTPITITIETEVEAVAVWACLGMPQSQAIDFLDRESVVAPEEFEVVQARMWNDFDDIFDPRK